MPTYNFYFMNQRGHIDRMKDVDAGNDREAMALARADQGSRPLEVWCNHRKVFRIEALSEAEFRAEQTQDRPAIGSLTVSSRHQSR